MIDILDNNNEMMNISVDELMHGSNRLSPYNYVGTNDPFYEPYTFYTTLCNNENTYYVYYHSSGILTASFGNTRITYTPTVMPDGLKFALNGVYDYYPYGKILREYVQGQQEKYLTTHHQRDEETGLDYRGARFYDCDVARFLSLDPLAVKYVQMSPYCYVANTPINAIDPDGKDIIFIIDREAAGTAGHIAVLIGNEKTGWRYVSINGTTGKTKPWGRSEYADKGTKIMDEKTILITNPREAMIRANSINPSTDKHSYDEFIHIVTTEQEDNVALIMANKAASEEIYGITGPGNSCIDVAIAAFKSVVVNRGGEICGTPAYIDGEDESIPNLFFNRLPSFVSTANIRISGLNVRMRQQGITEEKGKIVFVFYVKVPLKKKEAKKEKK
nr:RHS repeat-associated core domain-containing protein [Bacteroidota bacterium]